MNTATCRPEVLSRELREASPGTPSSSALHLFARAVSAGVFVLLLAGGSVTSTGSGLAVPDWPLSFGRYFPRMTGGVFFEHGHRMLAGLVGLAVLALAAAFQLRGGRRGQRLLAWAAALAVLVQALLGGITVLYGLPPQVSVAHACLAQAIFCAVVALAEASSPGCESAPTVLGARSIAWTGVLATTVVYGQLILGAVLRHTGSGLWPHVGGAVLAALSVLWLAARVFTGNPSPALMGPARTLAALIGLQLLLGAGTAAHQAAGVSAWEPGLATLHLGVGALILATSLTATLRAIRLERG